MSLSQLQQENQFKKRLTQFWASKGITQIKIPQIGGQQLNLFKLYKSVCRKGGGEVVSHNKLWKEIVDEFGLPQTCTSASFTLKNHYQRYLLAYQQKYYFGKDDNAQLPQLVAGRMRKVLRSHQQSTINQINTKFPSSTRTQNQISYQSNLSTELHKYYQNVDKNAPITFIKRTKMYPATSQVKHMILAFESGIKEQVIYAINILTMFSVNTQAPFLFYQYPNVLESINDYLRKNYPPKDIFTLQCFRNLTLALRNLSINFKNLSPILDSPILSILMQIFTDKFDRQLTRNVVDVFSSMTKVGWDCRQLTILIEQYFERDTPQDLQTAIDLLRALSEESEQLCQEIAKKKIDLFARLLLHSAIQVRQAILQIFACIIQKSQTVRWMILHHHKFITRIFGFLSYSHGHSEKQAHLAGFILGCITHTPENLSVLKDFEKDLMLISFNDDSLSLITASILYSISHPESVVIETKEQGQG